MEAISYVKPIAASDVKKGMYILMDEKTCKIMEVTTSKTGKHGHMKVALVGLEIFTQTKHMSMSPGHQMLHQIMVEKKSYLVLAVLDDMVDFLNESDEVEQIVTNKDLKIKEDMLITITTCIEGKTDKYTIIRKITEVSLNK